MPFLHKEQLNGVVCGKSVETTVSREDVCLNICESDRFFITI